MKALTKTLLRAALGFFLVMLGMCLPPLVRVQIEPDGRRGRSDDDQGPDDSDNGGGDQ